MGAKKNTKMLSPAEDSNITALPKWFVNSRDNYYKLLDKIWSKIPNFLGTLIATLIIFIAGSTMRGDWLLILVYFIRSASPNNNGTDDEPPQFDLSEFSLEQLRLQGLPFFLLMSFSVSYTFFFGVCGFIQWYFYIRQKGNPESWKCQPNKFLSPELERHEIISGTINVGIGCITFAIMGCYIYNGGYTTLYFALDEYGYTWLIASIFLLFIYEDAAAYYGHRLMHIPYLYRTLHKWHHYYKQPTAFSTTAFHPAEFLFFQTLLVLPSFVVPLHFLVYITILMYIYYFGLIAHCGVVLDSIWPWQPDSIFHDNHHQYFNINFGFNLLFWDKLHGTYRYLNNSMVGKNAKAMKNKSTALMRSDEDTILFEKLHMEGKILDDPVTNNSKMN